jgi:hypothetical protein
LRAASGNGATPRLTARSPSSRPRAIGTPRRAQGRAGVDTPRPRRAGAGHAEAGGTGHAGATQDAAPRHHAGPRGREWDTGDAPGRRGRAGELAGASGRAERAAQGGRGRAAPGRAGASAMAGEAGPRATVGEVGPGPCARKGQGRLGRAERAGHRGRAGTDAPGPARPSCAAAEAGGRAGHAMATPWPVALRPGCGEPGPAGRGRREQPRASAIAVSRAPRRQALRRHQAEGRRGAGGREREDRGSPWAVGRWAALGELGWCRGGHTRWGGD